MIIDVRLKVDEDVLSAEEVVEAIEEHLRGLVIVVKRLPPDRKEGPRESRAVIDDVVWVERR